MGPLDELLVGIEVDKAQGHAAMLAIAQDLALMAQAKVHLRKRKAICGLFERLQAILRRRRAAIALGVCYDKARARNATTANAAAQLVQGGQAKALAVLDDHDGSIGHIDAHLDHRGRNEHVDIAALKGIDHAVLLPRRHTAVKALDIKTRQRQAQAVKLGSRIVQRHGHGHATFVVAGDTGNVLELVGRVARLHERADHIGLLALFMRLADGAVSQVAARLGEDARRHAGTRNGTMADDARVQVAVDRKRQRARDGRRRHNEQVGPGTLGAQSVTLADAKPVLFVDDDERQVLKINVLRKHGMGAKEDIELAGLQLRMNVRALGRRRGARQERPGHTGLRKQRAGLIGILTRQHTRRRHDAGLRAAICRNRQRAGGNGGLAGTDIAQQQAVHHAPAIAHIMQDILECGLLLVAQRKRQGLFKRGQALARNVGVGHHVDQAAIVAQAQRELQVKAFLVGQAAARDIALCHARGKVNRAQRAGIAHKPALYTQRCRNGVKRVGDHFERTAHNTAHPRLAHAVTHVMNRQDGARGAPVLKLLEMRRSHLLKAVGKLNLTHHGQAVALFELLGNPGLSEKGNLQHARVIHERNLGYLHARTRLLLHNAIDRSDDGADGADGRHLDGPGARKVEVSMRDMEKEVPHRPNSQTAKGLLTFTRNIFESRDILVERIALGKALRDARHGAQLGHGQLPTRSRRSQDRAAARHDGRQSPNRAGPPR